MVAFVIPAQAASGAPDWIAYASAAVAALSLIVALVFGLYNRAAAKAALEISRRQEARRESRLDIYVNDTGSWRTTGTPQKLLGVNLQVVTREQFPTFSSQAAFKGYRPQRGESVEQYLRPATVRVVDSAGRRSIVESTYPLRGHTPAGRLAPIDLSLERHGSGFAPASAAVGVRFPSRIADGILMELSPNAALNVRPLKTREAKVARLSSGKATTRTPVSTPTPWPHIAFRCLGSRSRQRSMA